MKLRAPFYIDPIDRARQPKAAMLLGVRLV